MSSSKKNTPWPAQKRAITVLDDSDEELQPILKKSKHVANIKPDGTFEFVIEATKLYDASTKAKSTGTGCDYTKFLERHGDELLALAREQCAEAFDILDNGNARNVEELLNLSYQEGCRDVGWYIIILRDSAKPDWLKLYIGSAYVLCKREREHRSHAAKPAGDKTKKTVHDIWSAKSTRSASFRFLGKAKYPPGWTDDDKKCYKNSIEMFLVIAFQTLPSLFTPSNKGRLEENMFRQPNVDVLSQIGLNMRLPLAQGSKTGGSRNGNLVNAEDPELAEIMRKTLSAQSKAMNEKQKADGHLDLIAGMWKVAKNKDLHWRAAEHNNPAEPAVVWQECQICLQKKVENPVHWECKTPKYSCIGLGLVYGKHKCDVCKKDQIFKPINKNIAIISLNLNKKRVEDQMAEEAEQ